MKRTGKNCTLQKKNLKAITNYCYFFCTFVLYLILGSHLNLHGFLDILIQIYLLKLAIMLTFNCYIESWVYLGSNMSPS